MAYIERKISKFKAVRTLYGGYNYPSKLEANVAYMLDIRKRAGEIKDWERQFKCEMIAYNCHGEPAITMSHKVDFRAHENDGSFTLIEAKGVETADYQMRRKWLEKLWLPEHLDHTYEVVKEKSKRWAYR